MCRGRADGGVITFDNARRGGEPAEKNGATWLDYSP